ncbi:MAG: hypothetical protein F4Y89_13095 [Gammaproteobacteria bacterium]|nr:hypothetical protein [Gammaproteobacteria bacterium]MXY91455.1 hypothetical protein [Gammaproteobacteria bacterium]MYG95820.1 hypothetical protein [Gammaproteobacteria bacterium]
MATERPTVLSDRDYQELIASRVLDKLRSEQIATRRWRIGIGLALFVGIVTILVMWYLDFRDLREDVETISIGPIVEGVDSLFSDLNRLEIVGFGFGESFGQAELYGQIELYYEPSGEFCRSSSLLLDAQAQSIVAWSDERIVARLMDDQRQEIMQSLFANCAEPPFDLPQPMPNALANREVLNAIVPYISVITVDRRRSPVW